MTILKVRVQQVVMPSGVESATLLSDGIVVEPVDRFLAHLTAIERSPNTVKAYAHDLRDFFAFLGPRGLEWSEITLEDLGRFVAWLLAGRGPRRRCLAAAMGGGKPVGGVGEPEAVGVGVVL